MSMPVSPRIRTQRNGEFLPVAPSLMSTLLGLKYKFTTASENQNEKVDVIVNQAEGDTKQCNPILFLLHLVIMQLHEGQIL